MVKRQKVEDVAGVIEFQGRTAEDPEFVTWLAEYRAHKGGKVRVSLGGTGVRVMFSEAADMAWWKARSEKAAKGKKSAV
jgi:erythromycin esterase-like protein